MPTSLDVAFAIFYAVGVTGVAALYFDRRLKRQIAAGVPNARLNAYRRATIVQWALAIATISIWSRERRPWRTLGFVPPDGWRLWFGLALMVVIALLVVRQNHRVRRLAPERADQLRSRMGSVEMILPRDAREFRWFMGLSCTAGFCEELLYRGFLTWLIAAYAGIVAAVIVVSLCFGLAHAYQGAKGMLRTGLVAFIMSGIVLASGWLIPAMVIHALVDVAGGVLGFELVGRRPAPVITPA
jgi:membrane protease YdiL (CAAX protease family)